MQAMLPCNVALIVIATLFYTWRDVYVPRRKQSELVRDRVAKLLWRMAEHASSDSPATNSAATELPEETADERPEETEPEAAFLLFSDVECRACGGRHAYHLPSDSKRSGGTFEYTCPSSGRSAWVWWLREPAFADQVPSGSVALTWVQG